MKNTAYNAKITQFEHVPFNNTIPRGLTAAKTPHVRVELTREEACLLFNDLNRVLSLIDDTLGSLDVGDAASADRLSGLVAAIQEELHP